MAYAEMDTPGSSRSGSNGTWSRREMELTLGQAGLHFVWRLGHHHPGSPAGKKYAIGVTEVVQDGKGRRHPRAA
jgi:hypothetical protein